MIDLEKERKSFEKTCTKHGANIGNNMHTEDNFKTWCLRAKLAQAEIIELKQKLARYENPDCVLVPRKPTKEIVNHLEYSMAEKILKDDEDFIELYKAMIKAVEKDNVPKNS